jgi:hypothetical protein
MNLLSLVGPRLDNICQIRRKWYYLSVWIFLQSKRGLKLFSPASAAQVSLRLVCWRYRSREMQIEQITGVSTDAEIEQKKKGTVTHWIASAHGTFVRWFRWLRSIGYWPRTPSYSTAVSMLGCTVSTVQYSFSLRETGQFGEGKLENRHRRPRNARQRTSRCTCTIPCKLHAHRLSDSTIAARPPQHSWSCAIAVGDCWILGHDRALQHAWCCEPRNQGHVHGTLYRRKKERASANST